jgi:hypothetical protein
MVLTSYLLPEASHAGVHGRYTEQAQSALRELLPIQ